MTQDSLKV